MDAAAGLAQLDRQRAQAAERVQALEREQAAAAQAVRTAAAALAEHERRGGRAAEQAKLEGALAAAREAAADPALPAKVEGARARVRDLDAERQTFVGEHLTELIAPEEAEGQTAVDDMLAAAQHFLDAYHRREQSAGRISALASAVSRIKPSDVGPYTNAERAARELGDLLMSGEPAPTLLHYPGTPRHAASVAGTMA